MLSGAFSTWIDQPMSSAQSVYAALVVEVHKRGLCDHGVGADGGDVSCLLSLSPTQLIDAAAAIQWSWGPVMDGVELTDVTWKLAQRGHVAPDVDVIVGSVGEDSTFTPAQRGCTKVIKATPESKDDTRR